MHISQKQLVVPIKCAMRKKVLFSSCHLNVQFLEKYLLVVAVQMCNSLFFASMLHFKLFGSKWQNYFQTRGLYYKAFTAVIKFVVL